MKALAFALAFGLALPTALPANAATLGNVIPFEPAPVTAPGDLGRDASIRAVVRAFVMRGWRITGIDAAAGYVDAEYPIRVHVARVRARVSEGRVTFHYRESEKIEHGWRIKSDEKTHPGREQFLSSGRDAEGWSLADSPQGPESTLMIHPKYQEWVQDVSRTLEGTFRLETLGD